LEGVSKGDAMENMIRVASLPGSSPETSPRASGVEASLAHHVVRARPLCS
jgi:hypothetical protein